MVGGATDQEERTGEAFKVLTCFRHRFCARRVNLSSFMATQPHKVIDAEAEELAGTDQNICARDFRAAIEELRDGGLRDARGFREGRLRRALVIDGLLQQRSQRGHPSRQRGWGHGGIVAGISAA